MGPLRVEVVDIGLKNAPQVVLTPNQEPIQTLAADRSDKALTHRIGTWSLEWGRNHVDVCARRHCGKAEPIFIVIIADKVFWTLAKRRGLAQLLRPQASLGCRVTPT